MTVSIYKLELSKEEIIRELSETTTSQWKTNLDTVLSEFGITLKSEEMRELHTTLDSIDMKPLIEKGACALRTINEEDLRKMHAQEEVSKEAEEIVNQLLIETGEWVTEFIYPKLSFLE